MRSATGDADASCAIRSGGYVRSLPTISSRTCGREAATWANAFSSTGRWRRLKIEPTKSTSGSRGSVGCARGISMPRCTTRIRSAGSSRCRTISSRENCEIVTTRDARTADQRASRRRRVPSLQPNHSGWAMNDTSCTTTTKGAPPRSGALYPGAKKTLGRSRRAAAARDCCSQRVPPAPGTRTTSPGKSGGNAVRPSGE